MTRQAVVSFCFDDGYASAYTHVAPLFARKRSHCGFAINSRRQNGNGKCTMAELLELQASGFEICNHGATHKNLSSADIDPAAAAAEIRDGYNELIEAGFMVHTYVAANSVVNDAFIPYIKEHHTSAYTIYKGATAGPEALLNIGPNPFKLHRTSLFNVGMAGILATIDTAITASGIACFYDHDPMQAGYARSMPLADLEKVLDYCIAAKVLIATPHQTVLLASR